MEKKKNPRQKDLNIKNRRHMERVCASIVNWLLDNHYEEFFPLLEKWKDEQ